MTTHPDERDRAWFEALFDRHHRAVLAYARRRVGEDADDVLAEVFATAWARRRVVPDDPLPWLYRTAGHHVLHARRSAARWLRTSRAAEPSPPVADHAEDVAAGIDRTILLRRVLAGLPQHDHEVLRLWAWEDLDPAAIGYVLGCRPATVRVRLHRAQQRLRAALGAVPEFLPAKEYL